MEAARPSETWAASRPKYSVERVLRNPEDELVALVSGNVASQ